MIAHAGYSAAEHLAFAKATHVATGNAPASYALPVEITAECLFGTLLSIAGAVLYAGDLQEVKMEREMGVRSMDLLLMCPSFRSVRHRGSNLFAPRK
ncbi:hypothetical protein HDU82_005077 [Entophlyctis luteolus]|nr:hypothetical protein HDU82_005077 [Entophlyctis luteolus]